MEGERNVGQVVAMRGLVGDVDSMEADVQVSWGDGDDLSGSTVGLNSRLSEIDPSRKRDFTGSVMAIIGD